jgi:t-SNARE complex subunit (syntaxin)
MGFNATRRYRDKKTVDIALLVAAIVIIVALLVWVFAAGGR